MLNKKAVKKLISKYTDLRDNIVTELNVTSKDNTVGYRCLKVLKDDYNLKISVLESILDDIEVFSLKNGIVYDDITSNSSVNIISNLDFNVYKSEDNKNINEYKNITSDYSYKKLDDFMVNTGNNYNKYDNLGIENDTRINTIDNSDGLRCTFKGFSYKELYGYDMSDVRYDKLNSRIEKLLTILIEEKGVKTFITDGSLGFDKIVFGIVHKLKKKYPDIKNVLAIPFLTQDSNWSENCKQDYKEMKLSADTVVYVDSIDKYNTTNAQKGEFHKDKLRLSTEYKLDNADILITLYSGKPSKAMEHCLSYASKVNITKIKHMSVEC